jgi:OmpA-OmpF porin, OOP family
MSTLRFPQPASESESFISAVIGHFTPDVVHSASSMIGESESSTRRALQVAAPTVLSGLTIMVSSRGGQDTLGTMIREGGYSGLSENPMSMFRGGSATNYIISGGQRVLGKVFGNNVSTVVEEVGKSSGVNPSSATKLLALTAPLTLGVLGKRASAQGLGISGLADKLLGQRGEMAAAAPAGLSRILGLGPQAVTPVARTIEQESIADSPVRLEHFTEPTVERRPVRPVAEPASIEIERAPERRGLWWLPFALLLIAAFALLGYLLSRTRAPRLGSLASQSVTTARNALSNISLPGGVNLSVPQGSINYNLAKFLGDNSATDLPRTFVFDHLNFESASTQLTPESGKTVNDLAQVLKAYPNARVQLVGNTDNTGTREANQTLSENRANAVKAMLASDGVAADRISTVGRGQDNPVASNDTEQGQAQNRRIELNVIQK